MKIALINPPQFTKYPQPPMVLAILAAVLEQEDYSVSIIDANALHLLPDDIPQLLNGANIIGITAMTPTIGMALAIARSVRHFSPKSTVIMGGVHPTLMPREILAHNHDVDIVVRGEGESTLLKILKALPRKEALARILGVSFRLRGKVLSTPDRITSTILDELPLPAYHLLPWSKYRPHPPHGRALPFLPMITSRGCPFHCVFCSKSVFGNKFRCQSPRRIVDEMEHYQHEFGIKEIGFYDDVFTLDKNRAHAIADEILRRGLKICWTCESRVNLVDKWLLEHMKSAGCYSIAYGIESGSREMLEVLDKDATIEQAEEAVRISNEVGLQTIGYFMVGSPGETPDTIRETIQFAKKLRLDYAQFSITTPFPGTKLYELYTEDCDKDNGKVVPWDSFIYAGARDVDSPVFDSASLSREDIEGWVSRAYKEFYLRIAYIWQRLSKVRSVGDVKMLVKGVLMLAGTLRKG